MDIASWFKGIRGRLLTIAALPIVGFTVAYFVASSGMDRISSHLTTAHKEIIPVTKTLNDLIIARNKYGYHIFAAIAMYEHAAIRAERLNLSRQAIEEWRKAYAVLGNYPRHEDAILSYEFIEKNKDHYLGMLEKVIELTGQGTPASIAAAKEFLLGDIWKLGSEIGSHNGLISKAYVERAKKEGLESESVRASAGQWMAIISVAVNTVILLIVIFISSRIAGVITLIAGKLAHASEDVTASVHQLSQAGSDLSQSSTEAAASLEETVASLEELSSMVRMNSDHARQAAVLSASSQEAAEKGEMEMRELIRSMVEISQSSKKIEEIISVVDDIAFQTNLLALNAAVEAARAGEQGKGFAVVAEAVRTLAQRSSVAAKDISGLIKVSVGQVERGSEIADQCGEVLGGIVTSVKKVADLNNEISAASSEQTAGIQQISKAMNQLDQVSQTNAASSEEVASTCEEINRLSLAAQHLTHDLEIVVRGEGPSISDSRRLVSAVA